MRIDALHSIIMICLCMKIAIYLSEKSVSSSFGWTIIDHKYFRKNTKLTQSISNWYRIISIEWSIFQLCCALVRIIVPVCRWKYTFCWRRYAINTWMQCCDTLCSICCTKNMRRIVNILCALPFCPDTNSCVYSVVLNFVRACVRSTSLFHMCRVDDATSLVQ